MNTEMVKVHAQIETLKSDYRWQFLLEWYGKGAIIAYLYLCQCNDWGACPVHFKEMYLGLSCGWAYYVEVDGFKHRFKRD